MAWAMPSRRVPRSDQLIDPWLTPPSPARSPASPCWHSFWLIVRTVLHELVHVKQFARGELDSKYKGMRWKTAHVTDDVDYMDLPWEKEAYKMEDKLAAKFWSENLI